MAQLFSKKFGLLFRIGIIGLVMGTIGWIFIWRAFIHAYPYDLNATPQQPVPFSHKHHVGDDGIACRYCHVAVGKSAFASIPPLTTCMTCHSQLYTHQKALAPLLTAFRTGVPLHWKRVYKLPDFVYFNHSIHVAKGIGCVSCHGRVDKMPLTRRVAPLTMEWCLGCHRDPAKALRPHDEEFSMTWHARNQLALGRRLVRVEHIDKSRLTDCSVCHR
ncbi:MAG: cytochrome c3 family protein [Rhodanobacteraceae bacterium]